MCLVYVSMLCVQEREKHAHKETGSMTACVYVYVCAGYGDGVQFKRNGLKKCCPQKRKNQSICFCLYRVNSCVVYIDVQVGDGVHWPRNHAHAHELYEIRYIRVTSGWVMSHTWRAWVVSRCVTWHTLGVHMSPNSTESGHAWMSHVTVVTCVTSHSSRHTLTNSIKCRIRQNETKSEISIVDIQCLKIFERVSQDSQCFEKKDCVTKYKNREILVE